MTSRIVKTIARELIPFIFLFGIYILIYGHLSPGGGFQGGVILSMGVVLIFVVYGVEKMQKYILHFSLIEILGVTFFVIIGLLGILNGEQFYSNIGTIWLLNIIIGLKVFAGLVILYLLLIRWELAK
jgi:multicomponent Na+:H+ antiporter subunit B